MSHHRDRKHNIDGVIGLVLFGVFAVCILSVLLTGADVYRRLTARDQETYSRRTCAQYIATKVRQAQVGSQISVTDFGGVDALTLFEDIRGDRYVTQIYYYDGWLRELFTVDGGDFLPEDGEEILQAEAMDLSLDGGLLTVVLTDSEGEEIRLVLSLRGEGASS